MLVILPTTTILVKKSTENRSRAKENIIPVTAPITLPSPGINCIDSDGGKNFYVKGKTTGLSPLTGELYDGEDICGDQNNPYAKVEQLVEHYCDRVYHNNLVFDCPNGCFDGACIGTPSAILTTTPSIPFPGFKLNFVNPSQTIKVGDVFDIQVLIDTAGQKTLGADSMIIFDSEKVSINPSNVRTGNYFDFLQANRPYDPVTKQQFDNKLIMNGWQKYENNPKYSYNDSLFTTITIKAQAEGVSNISFDCTSGSTDTNIWDTNQNDIVKCPLEPLTLNIYPLIPTQTPIPPPSATTIPSITATPTLPNPTEAATLISPTLLPTQIAVLPTDYNQLAILNNSNPIPTYSPSNAEITFPPTVSPTPLENVVFKREIPTATPVPVAKRVQTSGNFLLSLFANILNLVFGRR